MGVMVTEEEGWPSIINVIIILTLFDVLTYHVVVNERNKSSHGSGWIFIRKG